MRLWYLTGFQNKQGTFCSLVTTEFELREEGRGGDFLFESFAQFSVNHSFQLNVS